MKKIISLFLAVFMTASLPFCAYAEGEDPEESTAKTYTITFVNFAGTVSTQYVTEGKTYNEERTEEEHRYSEPTVKEATCTEAGEKSYPCTVCGSERKEKIPAKGHAYPDEWTVVQEATEEAPGQKVKECRNGCGIDLEETIPQLAHTHVAGNKKETVVTPATCETAGEKKIETLCSKCDEVIEDLTRTEEIPATGHRVTKQSFESTEESDAYDLYTCDVCGQTWKYFTEHDWDEGAVAKEPSCTETGIRVYKCSKCGATQWEEIAAKGHIWSATSAACERCKIKDSVVSFTVASCDKTQYYVGDKWNSTLKLNVTFANHSAVITTKENLLENFSTASAGTVKYSVKYEGQRLENAVQITVVKPKLTVKTASGETAYNDYSYVLGDKGVKFKVQSNTGDKIQYAKGNYLSVSLSNGVYTVKPSKYFTINAKNYKNYYVTFYFNRNGHAYSTKLYFSCGITRLKCNTAASVYTQGASVSKTLSFTQTYIDGTTAKRSVKKSLPTSSVGKKSVSYSYYGQKASYTYYVKCKTPSLKVSAKSKAVSLSWKRISGATGYKIYRATSKNGKYTAVKTISKGSTTNYKNTGLKSKKTYYYKIVAVYSKNSKCNSSYSAAKGCKTK